MHRRWIPTGVALALPLVGLGLLLARPELDLVWEHHPSHFWLVLGTAAVNVILAYLTNVAASRHEDARIFLVSMAFLVSAGFLGLHALATPQALIPESNAGFVIATPAGLVLASVLAAGSVSPLAGPRGGVVLRHRRRIRWSVIGLLAAWGAVSLLRIPPLRDPIAVEELNGPLAAVAIVALALYAYAAWRYLAIARRRRSPVALAMVAALVLLAEAMIAVALSRSWHLSWWEWHVLMAGAFAIIALAARAEYGRTGSLVATLRPIYLEATVSHINRWHGRAMAELAELEARGEPTDSLIADLRGDGASVEEVQLLTAAAREMRRVDELFRPYLPQRLAERLLQEPDAARPGGDERVVSVLFADLAGFTSYAESHQPTDVIAMLNAYWAAVLPVIDASRGSVEHFAGDGVMVMFNAVVEEPDHVARAARCALEIQRVTAPIAEREGWPRFRIGINTGRAVVGNVGAAGRLSFATIGDTTNLAARLMATAHPGEVVVGEGVRRELDGGGFTLTPLGAVQVKGKREPVEAWTLA
ncbi:MAG TPA: adenylate/guanylate cyclase domain-containing protein [Candidatus Limnocylindria bacterium]|nr:adenylate/guanylate cyclase domain-containing protein [Candidatus Limnocylindria bacterium]